MRPKNIWLVKCAACGQTYTQRSGHQFPKHRMPPYLCGACGSLWVAVIEIEDYAREFAQGKIKEKFNFTDHRSKS